MNSEANVIIFFPKPTSSARQGLHMAYDRLVSSAFPQPHLSRHLTAVDLLPQGELKTNCLAWNRK